jgi:hypothetical protein
MAAVSGAQGARTTSPSLASNPHNIAPSPPLRRTSRSLSQAGPSAQKAYLASVRVNLNAALCLRNFPSQLVSAVGRRVGTRAPAAAACVVGAGACAQRHHPLPPTPARYAQVERHNRPEVEDRGCKELLLPPVTIQRTEGGREAVLIEPSINSVRVSLRIKQADDLERLLVHKFAAFLQQRAEAFVVLRRRPVPGWDMSFLVTHAHTEALVKARLVDFIVGFMEGAWATEGGDGGGTATTVSRDGRCGAAPCYYSSVHDCEPHAPPPPPPADIDREVSAMKIAISARSRLVAGTFLDAIAKEAR